MLKTLGILFGIICTLGLLNGCDPLTVHKVTSTIFDGVPSMPPAEEYCKDYHQQALVEEREAATKQNVTNKSVVGSFHPPYKEKKCNNCHDKSTDSGLIKPRNEVCFVCHPDIAKKRYVHGPVSVGACLECHDPHTSAESSLLKVEKGKLCAVCHKEKRIAEGLHNKVFAAGMLCTDCHDPHSGDAKYFLR